MKLNTLRLTNFRQHADTRIAFDDGLTGIIGPNGSGKTTILEAIAFALYGVDAARGTRESIRFSRAQPRATVKVELEFELAGHRYRVTRGLTSAECFLDDAASPIASSISGVSELLRRRLGMNRSEFFHTYFTGQKELDVMAAMKPAERGQFLSRVLGYDRLREAQSRVREERRLLTARIIEARAAMTDADSVTRQVSEAEANLASARVRAGEADAKRVAADRALASITPRWESAQGERERVREIEGEERLAQQEEAQFARDVARLDADLAWVVGARAELEQLRPELARYPDLMVELHRLDALNREEGRRQTLQEGERSLAEELARLRERRAALDDAPRQEREMTSDAERVRRELTDAQRAVEAAREHLARDRQEASTRLQALRKQFADLKEQRDRLVSAGEDGTCPTCARPLGGHFRSVLDLLDEQMEAVRVDGNYFKLRVEQLETMPDDVRAAVERGEVLARDAAALDRTLGVARAAVRERGQLDRDLAAKETRHAQLERELAAIPAGYDAARHAAVRVDVERLAPLDAKAARLSAHAEREPQLRRDRGRADGSLTAARARIAELAGRREAVGFSEADYEALRAAHEPALAAAREAERTAIAARGEVAGAVVARDAALAARRQLAEQQARLDTLQRGRLLHDELDRAFTDLRTDLNLQLRPELSDLASTFLAELTDGRYGALELDDQYAVLVLEDGIPKPVISGGEEDLANLVLRLAISQMIAERAGQSFSLLVLDEIFGSLDESRRQGVVDLLRRLHDRFEQVIVITHIESVREGLDRVISVRLDAATGASVVEQGAALPTGAAYAQATATDPAGSGAGAPPLETMGAAD